MEINLKFNSNSPEDLADLVKITTAFCGLGVGASEETKPQKKIKSEKAKDETTKEPEKVEPAESENTEVPEPTVKDHSNQETKKKISLDALRVVFNEKLPNNRPAIKDKLRVDMGYPDLTSLPEEKYIEFLDFLNSLP